MNLKNCNENKYCWGGKRDFAGRKKTCRKKVPFNRRINEDVLMILREYAQSHNITETEALESAIILQSNIEKIKGDKIMKIVIPSSENKLCGHFGHCEYFTFVDVNPETKEILNIEKKVPEDGISCQSASWIATQGANIVLAGGMGARPMAIFAQNGVQIVAGCPELEIETVINQYLNQNLVTGDNTCGKEHHHCHNHQHNHNHGEHHHCHHEV